MYLFKINQMYLIHLMQMQMFPTTNELFSFYLIFISCSNKNKLMRKIFDFIYFKFYLV